MVTGGGVGYGSICGWVIRFRGYHAIATVSPETALAWPSQVAPPTGPDALHVALIEHDPADPGRVVTTGTGYQDLGIVTSSVRKEGEISRRVAKAAKLDFLSRSFRKLCVCAALPRHQLYLSNPLHAWL